MLLVDLCLRSKSEGEKKALIRDMKDLISDREAVEALRNAVSASQAASVAPPRRPAGPRRSSGLSSGLYAVPEEPGQRGGSARSEAGASTGAVRRGPLGRAASMAVRGGRMSGGSMMGGGSAAGGGGAGASRLGQSEARRAMLGRSATLATIRVS